MDSFEARRAYAQRIRDAIASGEINTASRATLTEYSTWLCTPLARGEMAIGGEYEQTCELIRLHMLRTMIDEMEKRNSFIQRIVIVLAVAALVVAIPQIWFAYKADKRAETDSEISQVPQPVLQSQTSAPTPPQHPTTNQVVSPTAVEKTKKTAP